MLNVEIGTKVTSLKTINGVIPKGTVGEVVDVKNIAGMDGGKFRRDIPSFSVKFGTHRILFVNNLMVPRSLMIGTK